MQVIYIYIHCARDLTNMPSTFLVPSTLAVLVPAVYILSLRLHFSCLILDMNLKQNGAQGACAESTHKGVNSVALEIRNTSSTKKT